MSQVARRDIEAALTKKGFTLDSSGDHDYYYLTVNGAKTGIYTKLSRGTRYREIQSPLVAKIAEQIGLSKTEFMNFVNCTLSGAQHRALLVDRNLI